jgi:23S rRNA U2552 (ribose-2'-O)-methylase RlmE/FtsJ
MFKKSPKNCFKPVLPSSSSYKGSADHEVVTYTASATATATATVGSASSEQHNKSNNGPILSYFNYFLLPQVDIITHQTQDYMPIDIRVATNDTMNQVYVSSSIYAHLCDIKHQIEKYQDTWDNIKKFTNPYEYIHSNITGNKTNISKLRPLSRSFYKMIEIVKNNNILSRYQDTIVHKPEYKMGIKTFHLAEGPGGFIEAISYLRGLEYHGNGSNYSSGLDATPSSENESIAASAAPSIQILKRNTEFHDEYMKEQEYLKLTRRIFENQKPESGSTAKNVYGNDRYYGMTLVNDDPICPGWKKTRAFLESHPNVIIENGADKTGNLISLENFLYCAEKYKNKMDIVTADGGFDFSVDFNHQETMATKLILCEVFYALALQKQGGSFILKIFDVFHKATVDIIYILSYYYDHVSIMKPYTSRIANSEKYVICQGFKITDSTQIIQQFANIFDSIQKTSSGEEGGDVLSSLLPFEHDLYFLNKIEDMNAMVSFQQIENITSTLSIITNHRNSEKLEQYKRANVNKCIAWCEKYDIPHNAHHACFQSTNIFLHKSIPMVVGSVGVGVGM